MLAASHSDTGSEDGVTAQTVVPRERLWKVPDVVEYLGVSASWVYLHVSLGDLPYLRVGGLLRFEPDAVRGYARGDRARQGAVIPLRPDGG